MTRHESFALHSSELARAVLAADDPYDAGMAILAYAVSCVADDGCECPHAFWLIWGSLTDAVDGPQADPTMTTWATEAMRRASSEWLTVAHLDHPSVTAYLDRWVYDECGYEPPA